MPRDTREAPGTLRFHGVAHVVFLWVQGKETLLASGLPRVFPLSP